MRLAIFAYGSNVIDEHARKFDRDVGTGSRARSKNHVLFALLTDEVAINRYSTVDELL